MVFKCLKFPDGVPENFRNTFIHNNTIHNYNTRACSNNLYISSNFNLGESYVHHALETWNNLPDNLKQYQTLSGKSFNKKVKEYYLQQQLENINISQ